MGEPTLVRLAYPLVSVSVTPTVEATPDYSAGDVIGGLQTLTGAGLSGTRGCVIQAVHIYSKVAIGAAISIVFFKANPSASTFTENGVFAVHADDIAKIAGVVTCSTLVDLGTPHALFAPVPVHLPILMADGTTAPFAVAIAGGTENLAAAADLTFVYMFEQR